ncbi:hypothetical protein AAHA92_09001 [Salvia divinorum]|uniref:Uncharacterized protein n=1 Tax=Salvia divinorum TaxID=28513 RepID=A0ABD1HU54_SALDI
MEALGDGESYKRKKLDVEHYLDFIDDRNLLSPSFNFARSLACMGDSDGNGFNNGIDGSPSVEPARRSFRCCMLNPEGSERLPRHISPHLRRRGRRYFLILRQRLTEAEKSEKEGGY